MQVYNPAQSPNHGGRLNAAMQQYQIPHNDWLDLSTGINPNGWPVPVIPENIFNRLPEDDDGLLDAAHKYYGVKNILPIAGSQAAIQLLPQLRAQSKVGVIAPGYQEHAYCWH
ncbi:MAG: threonine-phosphate decarboxylase, partial [Gammaproteobacteria bacterium]|nr:threonine-phosphate decarboxylase [Gammaproteobacteria bacterium]